MRTCAHRDEAAKFQSNLLCNDFNAQQKLPSDNIHSDSSARLYSSIELNSLNYRFAADQKAMESRIHSHEDANGNILPRKNLFSGKMMRTSEPTEMCYRKMKVRIRLRKERGIEKERESKLTTDYGAEKSNCRKTNTNKMYLHTMNRTQCSMFG